MQSDNAARCAKGQEAIQDECISKSTGSWVARTASFQACYFALQGFAQATGSRHYSLPQSSQNRLGMSAMSGADTTGPHIDTTGLFQPLSLSVPIETNYTIDTPTSPMVPVSGQTSEMRVQSGIVEELNKRRNGYSMQNGLFLAQNPLGLLSMQNGTAQLFNPFEGESESSTQSVMHLSASLRLLGMYSLDIV